MENDATKECEVCAALMLNKYIVCPACGHVEGSPKPPEPEIDFEI